MTIIEKQKNNNQQNPKIFWFLLSVIFIGILSYGYFVKRAIVNVVARQNLEQQLTDLNANVLKLEAEYVKMKNNITLESAKNMGFVAVLEPKFIKRDSQTLDLSLVTHDR